MRNQGCFKSHSQGYGTILYLKMYFLHPVIGSGAVVDYFDSLGVMKVSYRPLRYNLPTYCIFGFGEFGSVTLL